MKKFLSILICGLLLCGCHGSKGQTSFVVPDELDTSKKISITFWAKNDTNKTQTEIYEKAIQDFESYYPNIDVKIRLYTDYGKIYNDVITNISTNTTPNVCITYPDHIATYKSGQDVVLNLDELMVDDKYGFGGSEIAFDSCDLDKIIPQYLNEGKIDGVQYAIPFMRSTEACYINKTYVEKLGYSIPDVLTWDFIWEVSQAAMAKDENGNFLVNGQKVLIPFIYKSTDNMMIQMLKQLNADYTNENGEVLLFNDTTKSILNTVAENAKTGAFSTFKISSYPANFLNAGQCLFAIDSTAGSTWMGTQAPLCDISEENIVDFETVVKEIPQYDPDHKQMISQGPSICIFNKQDPQEVLASWLFAQYLLSDDVQIAYSQTEGYVPVTKKAQESEEYISYLNSKGKDNQLHYNVKIEATELLLDNIENTFVTPVFNGSASVRDASGSMIETVVKRIRRKQVVDDAYYDKLFEDMKSLYHLNSMSKNIDVNGDLGPLPLYSKILLGSLGIAWICILACFGYKKLKKE